MTDDATRHAGLLVEYSLPKTSELDLDRRDLELFYTDASAGTASPGKSFMIQRHAHRALSKPFKLFDVRACVRFLDGSMPSSVSLGCPS